MKKVKLIKIFVEKKYLLPLRLVFVLAAMPFAYSAVDAISTGIADNGKTVFEVGDGIGYYLYLFKKLTFTLFFLWLAFGGLGEKKEDKPIVSEQMKH